MQEHTTKTVLIAVFTIIIVASLAMLSIRFFFGGPEDDWLCVEGQWMSHGNPSFGPPSEECKKTNKKIQIGTPKIIPINESTTDAIQ